MDDRAPLVGRLRHGRLAVLCLAFVLAIGACGSASGGAGGGGGADTGKIIAVAQNAFGTSMISADVEDGTMTITLVDGFGAGGARLFMCDHVKRAKEQNDPSGALTIVMVDQAGNQLASSADC
jgi:hypothetical protein